ncbi:hypothetical protein FIBSPDRAFT_871508, partial [Athelia psychrophila]
MLIDSDSPSPPLRPTFQSRNISTLCSSLSQLESVFPIVLSSYAPYSFSVISDTCSCSLLTIYTSSLP